MEDVGFPPPRPFAAPEPALAAAPEPPDAHRAHALPAFAASRDRVRKVARDPQRRRELLETLEGDPSLLIRALQLANAQPGRARTVASAAQAVDVLDAPMLIGAVEQAPVFDPLNPHPAWKLVPQRFRAHAAAVRGMAERIATEVGAKRVDELPTIALLHDIGKLALPRAAPDASPARLAARTPEERLRAERERVGIDHAAVGGWLARRWQLPERVALGIETHHSDRLGSAAVVRLADMLVHYREGRPVDLVQLETTSLVAGLPRSTVAALLYELPQPLPVPTGGQSCPLSERELDVLRRVSEGQAPKRIALELGLAEKTVSNHLYRVYRRLEVSDRTQAVLMARDRGWI